MPAKQELSNEEIEQIKILFTSGLGAGKIALQLNRTKRVISRILTSLGLKHPKGYVNPPVIKSSNIITNEAHLTELKSLFDIGCGHFKIAKILNYEIATVRNTFEILNLRHDKDHRNPALKIISDELFTCISCGNEKNISHFTCKSSTSEDKKNICHSCRKSDKTKAKRKIDNISQGKPAVLKNDEPLSKDELEQIKLLFDKNTTRRKIAKILNIKIHRVRKAYKQMGLVGTNKVGRYGYVSKEETYANIKIRKQTDPAFRLRHIISVSINIALKRNSGSKRGDSITHYLPYSINELIVYLENQFEPWMTWQNQGLYRVNEWNDDDPSTWRWQIDHIIPHSTFNYTNMDCDEFRACWELSNLRPLSAKQNIIDGVRKI